MNSRLTFTISSPPDRENLVAELWREDEMWGELILQKDKKIRLILYPNRFGELWDFDLVESQKVLDEAKAKLLGENS